MAESIGELAVLRARLDGHVNGENAELLGRMGALLGDLERSINTMRMVSLATIFDRLPRVVRDAARSLGKDIDLMIDGADTEVDRAIAEELLDPLLHLLRNAVGHGLEPPAQRERAGKPSTGRVVVRAVRGRGSVRIDVSDDGRGIALERVAAWAGRHGCLEGGEATALAPEDVLRLITSPGFSTAESVTEVSGRGVGMDAVATRVRALGGTIELATRPGRGTTFTLRLPTTLAAVHVLRVRIADEYYVIPLAHIREAIELDGVMLAGLGGRESVGVRDELLPLIRLRRALRLRGAGAERAAVVAELGERAAALAVDELAGREQVLVKAFDAPASALPYFSGATLLADGRPALILDPSSMF